MTSEARARAAQEALALAAECKHDEERIAEYSRTLEQKVDARTHELRDKNDALETTLEQRRAMQQQLVMQEKLASLGALTAGIAHEIKNPLNFVNNFAELSTELTAELGQALAAPLDALAPVDRQYGRTRFGTPTIKIKLPACSVFHRLVFLSRPSG